MFNRKGQNIAEYSILIALVIAAAVAMQVYVKRGLQGRVADAVDHAPTPGVLGGANIEFTTKQYEPYYVDSEGTVGSSRSLTEDIAARGETDRTAIAESTTRQVGAYDETTWDDDYHRDDYDSGR
ncbi:hypothetical protein ACFL1D_00055 [Candidatus Omnitrophota bacterium]